MPRCYVTPLQDVTASLQSQYSAFKQDFRDIEVTSHAATVLGETPQDPLEQLLLLLRDGNFKLRRQLKKQYSKQVTDLFSGVEIVQGRVVDISAIIADLDSDEEISLEELCRKYNVYGSTSK